MNIKRILKLSRPRFWLYTLGPFLIGTAAGGNMNSIFRFEIWYGFLYFLLPANLFIYGVNDYFDRHIDSINPKKHKQEAYMRLKDARSSMLLAAISVLLCLPLLFINLQVSLALLTFIFVGFFYSSPPIRFKTKIVFDSFSNFFYIIPGIIGYLLIAGTMPPVNMFIAGSLWAIAMHLFSAIVDIEPDKKAGIRTSATALGYKKSLILTSLLWFSAATLVLPYSQLLLIGYMYAFLPLLVLFKKITVSRIYWIFPWINAVLGFLLFWIVLITRL
jgi:4-hydroxybenzoate polyprenyltransferase